MTAVLFGIPNCDTVKKARRWCEARNVEYRFHDFRKDGIDGAMLARFEKAVGWEVLLNRRGMMWRKLSREARDNIDRHTAMSLMLDNPAIIKRPVLQIGKHIQVGFDEAVYSKLLTR
ncbi:MAG: ArsC family reductase [Gammaproteobacteria bacterium]|nr:ArsC family reductase [Gammaproteobacteria bacterium]